MIVQTYVHDGENGEFFLFFQKKHQFTLNYWFFFGKILNFPHHGSVFEQS